MKKIDHFLTKEYANKYNEQRYGIKWLFTETFGVERDLSLQIDRDILHYNEFRQEISAALSEQTEALTDVTERWIYLLKPRVERLDFWANLWGTLNTVLVAALGAFAIVWIDPEQSVPSRWWAAAALAASFLLGLFRFDIDRKKLWYKYILSHLEAIVKLEARNAISFSFRQHARLVSVSQ